MQTRITDEFHEDIGSGDFVFDVRDHSNRFLDYELENVTGELLPRPYQFSGSCVGVGWWRRTAMLGDIVIRGDVEDVKLAFRLPAYGVGRHLAGMRGRGEGSFGGAQAKAGAQFGRWQSTIPKVPKGTVSNGWLQYSKSIELSGTIRQFPVAVEELG